MEAMKDMPDKYFELAIVDPPYGISITDSGRLGKYNINNNRWDDNIPTDDYFNELFRISEKSNYMGWKLLSIATNKRFYNMGQKNNPRAYHLQVVSLLGVVLIKAQKHFIFHQCKTNTDFTQLKKPVKLYKWILSRYAKGRQDT